MCVWCVHVQASNQTLAFYYIVLIVFFKFIYFTTTTKKDKLVCHIQNSTTKSALISQYAFKYHRWYLIWGPILSPELSASLTFDLRSTSACLMSPDPGSVVWKENVWLSVMSPELWSHPQCEVQTWRRCPSETPCHQVTAYIRSLSGSLANIALIWLLYWFDYYTRKINWIVYGVGGALLVWTLSLQWK